MATRLGQEEGTPADNLKASSTGTSGASSTNDSTQLSAIAGARRSRGKDYPTVSSMSGQETSNYEKFRKIVQDKYAQYTAIGRKQAKQQQEETELGEAQKKQQQKELLTAEKKTPAAETAQQQSRSQKKKQNQETAEKVQADQYAKDLAAQKRQYEEQSAELAKQQSEAAKAASEMMPYDQARIRYLEDNPDVARAGMDPWVHYTTYGNGEARTWPGHTKEGGRWWNGYWIPDGLALQIQRLGPTWESVENSETDLGFRRNWTPLA